MKNPSSPIILILLTIFLAGCTFFSEPSATPTFPPTYTPAISLPLETESTAAAELPTPTAKATTAALPTAISPIKATTMVDNLVLRDGPGMLFENIGLYPEYSTVTVMGRSQGDGWYFVVTEQYKSGWMKSDFVELLGDMEDLPFFAYEDANLVTGHVRTPDGQPASGIGVSIAPIGNDLGASYDATMTDISGSFYLFIPKDMTGDFQLGPNSYNCVGNLIVGECSLPYQLPDGRIITLPIGEGINIEFSLIAN